MRAPRRRFSRRTSSFSSPWPPREGRRDEQRRARRLSLSATQAWVKMREIPPFSLLSYLSLWRRTCGGSRREHGQNADTIVVSGTSTRGDRAKCTVAFHSQPRVLG